MSINRKRQRRLRQREKRKKFNKKLEAIERVYSRKLSTSAVRSPGGLDRMAGALKDLIAESLAIQNIKDDGAFE